MGERVATVFACRGVLLVAEPGHRVPHGPRFSGPPLDPLAEPVEDEALGRIALAALERSRDNRPVEEDHRASLYRAARVGGDAGLVRVDRDLEIAAEWIADALAEDGYDADFSRKSARVLDRFYDANLDGPGRPTPGGRLDEDAGRRLFALGAYVGKILEREAAARWRTGGASGEDVPMELADGSTVWPIRRAIDRFELGSEAGLAAYVTSLTGEPERRGLRRLLGL